MISVSLDEGMVFDILAINIIKHKRRPSENLEKLIKQMEQEIVNKIGPDKLEEIMESHEFKELIRVNEVVFDIISQVQETDGFARYVQRKNEGRYEQKVILQKKFFSNQVTEEKM